MKSLNLLEKFNLGLTHALTGTEGKVKFATNLYPWKGREGCVLVKMLLAGFGFGVRNPGVSIASHIPWVRDLGKVPKLPQLEFY